MTKDDLISRQAAIEAMTNSKSNLDITLVPGAYTDGYSAGRKNMLNELLQVVYDLPSAQPEITDEQAILYLQSTGWMQNHDREMYDMGLKKQLANDGGSYDSLVPCEDAVSREAMMDAFTKALNRIAGITDIPDDVVDQCVDLFHAVPSVQPKAEQPEIIRCRVRCRDCEHYKHCDWTGLDDFDDDDLQ